MLRYLTSGESHGKMLSAILEGMPKGIDIDIEDINLELTRRRQGYGRGARSTSIEIDAAEIIGGVRWGQTTGAPIGLIIKNSDWENRKKEMSVNVEDKEVGSEITNPRPGHADLAGMLKYNTQDAKDILERASARSTATQVAIGAICKKYLECFGIEIAGFVKGIGDVSLKKCKIENILEFKKLVDDSQVRCPDKEISEQMIKLIDKTKKSGDTLGGVISIVVKNVPVGLGSHVHWDRRLDKELASNFMGIPSVKTVTIGSPKVISSLGSQSHDEIFYDKSKGIYRKTNNAGGVEGGMSNGEDIIIEAGLKPIPTLLKPLQSIDIKTKKQVKAESVRSDVCVAPSAVVVGEAVAAFAIAVLHQEKFGGDHIAETRQNVKNYIQTL